MLVVLSVSHKDFDLAANLLRWIEELEHPDHVDGHSILIVGGGRLGQSQIGELVERAKQCGFAPVSAIHQRIDSGKGWPQEPNEMFRMAAQKVQTELKEPFLWLEPDCTPLVAGWLNSLEEEYKRIGKPFMGFAWDKPFRHMTGCAIYPSDVVRYNPFMLNGNVRPFDTVRPDLTLPRAHITNLIHHDWGDIVNNTAPTFGSQGALDAIPKEAVLFHRCKDGSLIERLRERATNSTTPWEGVTGEDICIVELGRFGDIINVLPVALHIHNTYRTPHFMVAKEFASVLDGVSYVKPIIADLHYSNLNEAVAMARRQFRHVLVTQVWGANWKQDKQCTSYNEESWRMAGMLPWFYALDNLPQFDQRDKGREKRQWKAIDDGKPMLLVNLTDSASSPWKFGERALVVVRERFGANYNVVDLSKMRCERIYDLLGIMDPAAALVSIDSAHLHLAAASTVPVVAILNDQPWRGSAVRRKCITLNYKQAENLPRLIGAITLALTSARSLVPIRSEELTPPAIYHACELHVERDTVELDRKVAAQQSWEVLYEKGVIPAHLIQYPRDAKAIGEPRELPYLKDCLKMAMDAAQNPRDIILFTNDDNWLHPSLVDILRERVSIYGCCSSQRSDVAQPPPADRKDSPARLASSGKRHMGRDLFAFTKRWLQEHWSDIPDFILGCSDWDLCLAAIVRLEFGITTTRTNLEDCLFPAELDRGYVLHQTHSARWTKPDYVNTSPGQRHNRGLFKAWAEVYAPHLRFHEQFLCLLGDNE